VNDATAVPLIVHSASRDPVEAINSLLRRGGVSAHCTWISATQDIPDALEQINPELLVCCPATATGLAELAALRDQVATMVPLIAVRELVDERTIAADMAAGARDTVSLQQPERLRAVIGRELRAFRLERALTSTLRSSQDYRSQLETVLRRSNDAIAQVQEGILVDANDAWLALFGSDERGAITGHPVMDLFEDGTHAALKAALSACLQGRWSDLTLKTEARLGNGSVAPLELALAPGQFDGEPSVRLIVPGQTRDERALAHDLESAVQCDPGTGLLLRRYLLAALQERLGAPMAGGVRFLACVRPDHFAEIEREIGLLASEPLLIGIAQIVRSQLAPKDLAGHFGGTTLLLLLERGNARDAEAWCEKLIERIGRHPFAGGADGRGVRATCSIGLAAVPQTSPSLETVAREALDALRRGRERGGAKLQTVNRADTDSRVKGYDEVWVKHIKAALLENRFRLVQQPIAALAGGERKMFDVAIRMLDTQGKDVLPTEFLPAATRNDLMKHIDRWVLATALSFVSKNRPDLLFVRLSADSVLDPELLPWLELQLRSSLTEPRRLCLQFTESVATSHLRQATRLIDGLRSAGVRVALEHFGAAEDSLRLLGELPLDFVKIDGSLMQGLATSEELQERVRAIAARAAARNVLTVAERVEDANTMAVVWQLDVQFIQGYFVHAPEEIVLKS
jgi:diguanylate cyclase (GGDEF)-like protein